MMRLSYSFVMLIIRKFHCILLVTVLWAGFSSGFAETNVVSYARRSVVKIYVTIQKENYAMPWQSHIPSRATGTGFVIKGRRLLTNAHIVSNARFIQVQKDGHAKRYTATVEYFGHDCDLAVLRVEDETFFQNTVTTEFADRMPELNDEVYVLGYPMGGTRLSITKGVVSRIDYSTYSHSGVDQHLVLQVDAAINPGNSGGPVIFNGKVAGLAFQGLSWGENIGYAIPMPVLNHFLDDIRDGTYNGYPELGAGFMDTRNTALRTDLGLTEERTGVVIYYLDPFGSAVDKLRIGDVLLSIDGHPIANDGTIQLEGNSIVFAELLERKQWGDSALFNVWRDGKEQQISLDLKNPCDPFVFRNIYNERPDYFVVGGLVFAPLTREYLRASNRGSSHINRQQLAYYAQYAKVDGLYRGRDEFVVLIRRLAHSVNTYAEGFVNGIVATVNGRKISNLSDVAQAVDSVKEGFHVVKFEGIEDSLVLDAKKAASADPQIFEAYGISSRKHLGDTE